MFRPLFEFSVNINFLSSQSNENDFINTQQYYFTPIIINYHKTLNDLQRKNTLKREKFCRL